MSWSTWSAASAPIPTAMAAAPVQTALVPTAINPAPAVMPPGLQYSQEQWAQVQQQNWQQWAQWQQQYQQWHQQYGAEYQKSMSALQGFAAAPQQPPLPGMPNTGVPPPLPTEPKPPLPPEDPPATQSTPMISSYSTMPPKPGHAGYSTAPPAASQPMQLPVQPTDQYNQRQNWQSNQFNANKRPFNQGFESEQNKRPKQWENQKPNANQWTNQPPPNISYNQPPPQAQSATKPNIEELSEAEKKFDKEFAAWEAQFNKWKDQNANHPDKTQYMEYEKKWESWRNSLLERREQMRRKRLAMSGASTGVSKPVGFPQMPNTQQLVAGPNRPSVGISKVSPDPSLKQSVATPDSNSNSLNLPAEPLPPHQNNEPLSFKPSQPSFDEGGEGFLKPSFSSSGGIPGLDLVKEDDGKELQKEDVEVDKEDKNTEEPSKGPDFDAISKGINSILGDQKLLSMLSMVSQNPPSAPPPNTATNSMPNITGFRPDHNFSAPPPPHQFTEAPPGGNFNMPPGANFSAPPPSYLHNEGPQTNLPPNDHSNQSYEERSNHDENYQQRESVNNFDDQTRSSFTMGLTEQDLGYNANSFSRNQLNKPPPNRFGSGPPSENDRGALLRSNFGSSMNRTNDPPFGGNRSKFGPNEPNFNASAKFGSGDPNFRTNQFGSNDQNKFGLGQPDSGSRMLPKAPSLFSQADHFNRGNNLHNESFNRGGFNRPDNYQNDNFSKQNKYGENFNSSNDFRRSTLGNANSFDDRRGSFNDNNFNKSSSFKETTRYNEDFSKDKFNQGDYDDFDAYNEDDDFEKYHQMFNEDEENTDYPQSKPSQNQGQQFGQNQGQKFGQNQGQRFGQNQGHKFGQNQGQQFGQNQGQKFGQNQGQQFGQNQGKLGQNQGKFGQNQGTFGQNQGQQFGQNQGQQFGQNQGQQFGQKQGQQVGQNQGQQFGQNQGEQFGQNQGQQFDQKVPPPRLMDIQTAPPEPVPEEEEPLFEPTTVVDYEHKSLRSSEPDVVVEPIHMFDYRHKPLNRIPIPQRPKWLTEAVKFIREFDPLAVRGPLNFERPPLERYPLNRRDERRVDAAEDRFGSHKLHDERDRRFSNEFENRNRGDRRSYSREDNRFERESRENEDGFSRRERGNRDEGRFDRDLKEDDKNLRRFDEDRYPSKRHDEDYEPKRFDKDFDEFSDEEMNFENTELNKHQQNRSDRGGSRSPMLSNPPNPVGVNEIAMIEDIINPPGRFHRPPRMVIILRGPPGSGKTYLAKLIKDKEVENGGSAPRILSLDDYFMVEHEKEIVEDGKKIKVKEMVYEYEAEMEESYRTSFIKSFKKTITDGYFPFIIVDNINDKVKYFGEMWSFAKQNGFQVYICQLDLDPALCTKRNIHNRSEAEIEECIAGWEPTPNHHPTIDATGFLQSSITDVEMEEVAEAPEEAKTEEAPEDDMRSKWDTFDCSINNLAKLDGVHKPLRSSRTMEEYLQMEDKWEPVKQTKPGQKRVRWADLEEQREQKKMRAIGFIVGHTNWNRMMDPTDGGSALTQTKYI